MASFQFAFEEPVIDRPGGEKTSRNREHQSPPEGPGHHRLGAHPAHLIIDEIHHDLHDSDRNHLADPDDLERAEQTDLLAAHDGGEQCARCPPYHGTDSPPPTWAYDCEFGRHGRTRRPDRQILSATRLDA